MAETPRYWFAAKRTGWGWGLPLTWEGWVIYAVWFVAIIIIVPYLHVPEHPVRALFMMIAMIIPLAGICYWKGEPQRHPWRH
jgi:hypothetical protein